MKTKVLILLAALLFAAAANAQEEKTMYVMKQGEVIFQHTVSDIDSIIFYKPVIAVTDISLDSTTLTLIIGTNYTLTATVTPANATDQTVTWISSDNTKATVVAGKVTAIAEGTVIITAKAGNEIATCTVTVKSPPVIPDGVLINGVVWATRNVDAPGTFATNPEDAGMFYQWNRNVGWSSTNPMRNSNGGTTWNSSNPTGNSWIKANDPSPAGWRVPTSAEQQSLLDTDKVTSAWVTQNGVRGRIFTDKTTGNTLFLPAVGRRYYTDGNLGNAGSYGHYWSSTPHESDESYAYNMDVYSSNTSWYDSNRRGGFSVRCVAE